MRFFIHVMIGLLLICPTVSAQRPEETQAPRNSRESGTRFNRPSGISGSVAANTRFVFVLTSNVLRQADGETLKWLETAELPLHRGSRSPTSFACNEPMIDPGKEDFYLPFLRVKIGQTVKKGDIIAYMYLPTSRENENSHIHFNLMHARQFQAPAIFDRKIVDGFHARWGSRRGSDGVVPIPACMGFLLLAPENPFGTGAKPRL